MPADVVLAIEVVSPSTKTTDRFAKPGEYAAAGIPCYWRIERDPLHVFAYQLREPARVPVCANMSWSPTATP